MFIDGLLESADEGHEKKALMGAILGALAAGGLAHRFSPEIAEQVARLGGSLGGHMGGQMGREGQLWSHVGRRVGDSPAGAMGGGILGKLLGDKIHQASGKAPNAGDAASLAGAGLGHMYGGDAGGALGSIVDKIQGLIPGGDAAAEFIGRQGGQFAGKRKGRDMWNQYGLPAAAAAGGIAGNAIDSSAEDHYKGGAERANLDKRLGAGTGLIDLARRAAGSVATAEDPMPAFNSVASESIPEAVVKLSKYLSKKDMPKVIGPNRLIAQSIAQGAAKIKKKAEEECKGCDNPKCSCEGRKKHAFWDAAMMLGIPALAAMGGGQAGRAVGEHMAGKPGMMARGMGNVASLIPHSGLSQLLTPKSVQRFEQAGQGGELTGQILAALLAGDAVHGNIAKRPRFEEQQQGYY